MIYVASPYSHIDAGVRHLRYLAVRDYTVTLFQQGLAAFSPIVYTHDMARVHQLPMNHLFWMELNERMMAGATDMHLLQLPGWRESQGVSHELDFAGRFGIPVKMVPYEDI